MNWCDYTVIGIIAVFAVIGLIRGFVFSAFKIASFFIAIFASVKLYPHVSEYLAGTSLYTGIRKSVMDNLSGKYGELAAAGDLTAAGGQAGKAAADDIIGGLSIPAFFKQSIAGRMSEAGELIDLQGILNTVGDEITRVIINVLSLVLLFVLIRIGLFIIGLLLKGLVRLPVVKQLDRLGGLVFGTAEGLLLVYVLCAVLLLFSSSPQFRLIFADVDGSLLARGFYQNNILVSWLVR